MIRQISSGMSLPVMRGGAGSSLVCKRIGIIDFGTPFVLRSLSGGKRVYVHHDHVLILLQYFRKLPPLHPTQRRHAGFMNIQENFSNSYKFRVLSTVSLFLYRRSS